MVDQYEPLVTFAVSSRIYSSLADSCTMDIDKPSKATLHPKISSNKKLKDQTKSDMVSAVRIPSKAIRQADAGNIAHRTENGFSSLIVAAPENDPWNVIEELLRLVAPFGPFVLYHQYIQVAAGLKTALAVGPVSAVQSPISLQRPVSAKRSITRSHPPTSIEATNQKERVVPSSQRPPTSSLRIDKFLRPFTIKAVHELLGKTGTITNFWMYHIKTHCYVTFSSVDEALATCKAVYNLQWPPNGGRLLVAEFVEPEEVKRKEDGDADIWIRYLLRSNCWRCNVKRSLRRAKNSG